MAIGRTVTVVRHGVGACFLTCWLVALTASSNAHEGVSDPEVSPDAEFSKELVRREAKKNQDIYRLRIPVPRKGRLERLTLRPPNRSSQTLESGSPGGPGFLGAHGQDLILSALLCLVAALAVRKLGPETAEAVLGHRPVGAKRFWKSTGRSGEAPADEKDFAKFLVEFKAGPTAEQSVSGSQSTHDSESDGQKKPDDAETLLVNRFLGSTPEHLLAMWNLLEAVQHESNGKGQAKLLGDLRMQLRTLKYSAASLKLLPLWQMASLTEGLVGQLVERESNITPNTLHTVAQGLELLVELCQLGIKPDLSTNPPIRLLAVDDDLISRKAAASALRKAFNPPDLAANGEAALAQISIIPYDVIFLDILMPGLDGFELYSKIRQSQANKLTAIVFVTSQLDFETRERAGLFGADGFISKPFLTFEITLTALVLALRSRLRKLAPERPLQDAEKTPAQPEQRQLVGSSLD